MQEKGIDLMKYKSVATSLAVVCIASGSYSIIDRVANALSIDSISRAMYENARILENLLKQEKIRPVKVMRVKENGKVKVVEAEKEEGEDVRPAVKVTVEKKGIMKDYFIDGHIADNEQVRRFLEEASRDVRLARSVASYAMSMVASAVSDASA